MAGTFGAGSRWPGMRMLLAFALALLPLPALAAQPEKPVTEREVTPVDVVTTPANDLNLRRNEIPAQLLAAQEKPYDLDGLKRCAAIASAVGELDAILGDDIDLGTEEAQRGPSAGKLAVWAVGSFIPFRGAIREISGANVHQRRMQEAIRAGFARRAFLKGVGQARGCRYPARAATPAVIAAAARAEQQDKPETPSPR